MVEGGAAVDRSSLLLADTGQARHRLVERREAPPSYVTGGRERLASVPGGPIAGPPRGLASPWRLPALHYPSRTEGNGKRDTAPPRPQKTGPAKHCL